MSHLYTNLAKVYHEIYQTLFNYEEEFQFYDKILKSNNINSIVEIGCGTGQLAKKFLAENYQYIGLDLHQEMLDIAISEMPFAEFLQADMRNFALEKTYESVLITGRSISYLTTNQDILDTFKSINQCLNVGGILLFDAIDATILFGNMNEDKADKLLVDFGENHYKRISKSKPNLKTGWTWNWNSTYFQEIEGEFQEIGKDSSTLRAFTKDEMALFLNLAGFELIEILPKKTYAWDDNFFIARKK